MISLQRDALVSSQKKVIELTEKVAELEKKNKRLNEIIDLYEKQFLNTKTN